MAERPDDWADALRVAALLSADPWGCGGVVVRAGAGPVRERWLDHLRAAVPQGTPFRRMPAGIADERLLGGLDLAATLRAGRPVAQTGLLAEVDGGVLVVPMAERLPAGTVAKLCAALDTGSVSLERDGLQGRPAARFGLVLLDEGAEDEAVTEALADRLAFRVDLTGVGLRRIGEDLAHPGHPDVPLSDPSDQPETDIGPEAGDPVAALVAAAADLGIASLRGPVLAARVTRLAARLAGRAEPAEADVIEAARLVLAPRTTRLPAPEPAADAAEDGAEPQPAGSEPTEQPPDTGGDDENAPAQHLDDLVLDAARAAIPPNLLAQLLAGGPRLRDGKAGRMGTASRAPRTGRPIGNRPGDPRRGRLDLIATLRAAAPWQRLRTENRAAGARSDPPGAFPNGGSQKPAPRRIVVLPGDVRIKTLRQHTETTTIFCVDASGSAALERLAETKGAVELLLAESYVRRDRVALVAFRGVGAEVTLPPTRSLARAKRTLAGLPGGGGTPLAAGIDAAATLALSVRRGGGSPVIVLLTDGRANVARSGEGGRARAGEEALAAGRMLKALGVRTLLIDTGARPEGARRLAEVAEARYVPLPYADAGAMSAAVRAAIA